MRFLAPWLSLPAAPASLNLFANDTDIPNLRELIKRNAAQLAAIDARLQSAMTADESTWLNALHELTQTGTENATHRIAHAEQLAQQAFGFAAPPRLARAANSAVHFRQGTIKLGGEHYISAEYLSATSDNISRVAPTPLPFAVIGFRRHFEGWNLQRLPLRFQLVVVSHVEEVARGALGEVGALRRDPQR